MKIKKALIFIAVLTALVMCAATFAACNDHKDSNQPPAQEDVTVSFDLGGEGLNSTQKGKAGDELTFPLLADTAQYYFGGWYSMADLSGEQVSLPAVFPEQDATYYAKWYVKYAFEVSVEMGDGEPMRDDTYDVKGEALKNERSSITLTADDFEFPAGYTLKGDTVTVEITGRDNVASVVYEKLPLTIEYRSNMAGVDGFSASGKYGMAVEDNMFGAYDDRRFVGWSESADGAATLFEGDVIEQSGVKELFAVWATEYTDALGGNDRMFVAKGKSSKAFLAKTGRQDIEGSFEETTGLFEFEQDESRLDGKLLESTFFYFKDAYNRTFSSDVEGDADKLTLKAGGGAEYLDKRGARHVGTYSVDEESGDFIFESDDLNVTFKIYEPFLGLGDMTFRVKDDMEGFYAEKLGDGFGYIVVYLDGYGNAFEVWDPDKPYFNPYDEIEEYYFEGGYTQLEDSDGMPQLELEIWRNEYRPAEYTIRVDRSQSGKFGGVDISGVYTLGDSYAGKYMNSADSADDSKALVLDGYEYATYMGEKSSYVAEIIQWYVYDGEEDDEGNQIYEVHSHSYIRFAGADGEKIFELNGSVSPKTYTEISPEKNVFSFENSTYLLYDEDSDSLMLELWHDRAVVWQSHPAKNRVTYYTQLDEGVMTKLEDGWTHFEGAKSFDYKITDCTSEYTVRWRSASNLIVFIEDSLYIDNSGVAKYKDGKNESVVDYTLESGLVDVYTFENVGGKSYIFAVRGDGDVQDISNASFLDETRAQSSYYARLVLADDGRALVGFRLSDGKTYAYLIDGTYEDGSDVSRFTSTSIEEGFEDGLSEYASFEFIPDLREDFVFIKGDGYKFAATGDGGVFETDGFGGATFTPAGAEEALEGSYEFVEGLTVFVYEGGEIFMRVEGEGNERTFTQVGAEAGYYYEIVEGKVSSTSSFFFLDGEGGVIYSMYDSYNGGFGMISGSYARGEGEDEDGYSLYTLTFPSDDLYMPGSYTAHLGEEQTTDGRVIYTYWLESPTVGGTYIVRILGEDVGMLTMSKGTAVLMIGSDSAAGSMLRCDVEDNDIYTMFADGTRQISENANGKCIFFSSGSYGSDDYFEFVFDITSETKAVDGKEYPVIDARMSDYGTYGRYDGTLKDERMYLDGHGGATLYDATGARFDKGSVRRKDEDSYILVFEGGKTSFDFVISLREGQTAYDPYRFEYVVYDEDSDNVYLGDDLTALVLDGFGGATYYDRYGVPTVGTYSYIVENIIRFEYDIVEVSYIALADGRFEKNSDEFISVGGVLYYYMGAASEITIPEGIKTIASGAFYGSSVSKVDFANVTRVEDDAMSGLALESVESDKITYVGKRAFAGMKTTLKTVRLPRAKYIGEMAFFGDTSIDTIELADVEHIGAQAFAIDQNEGVVLLDVTAVNDIAKIELASDAFVAVDFEDEPLSSPITTLRVLVKDIATVNALLADQNVGSLFKDNAVICFGEETTSLEASQTKFAVAYYSQKDGGVYILDGKLSKIVDIDLGLVQSVALYSYSKQQDGEKLELYMLENGAYNTQPVSCDANAITLANDALLRLGADGKTAEHTFTDGSGKELKLAIGVKYDVLQGLVFDAEITYDGETADSSSVVGSEISFVIGNAQYSVTLSDAEHCEVTSSGNVITALTSSGKYRVTLAVGAGGKLANCVKFEERLGENYNDRTINTVSILEDGTLIVNVDQMISAIRSDTYIISYDESEGYVHLFKNATTYGYDAEEEFRYGVGLTWDVETFIATKCTSFSIDDVEYTVTAFNALSDSVVHITIDMNGEAITFEVRYTVEFGYAIGEVRQL